MALLALSLWGIFDAAYLWWAYTSSSRPMACLGGGGCDVVRASTYAQFLGLPLPVFGLAMYAALALAILCEPLVGRAAGRWFRYGLALISTAGFLVSLYLTGVEAFILHAWCVWCVVSFLTVTAIFLIALLDTARPSPHPEGHAAIVRLRGYFALLGAAMILGLPGFFLLARTEKLSPAGEASAETLREHLLPPDSHIFGNPAAAVTVVEFGDFQCPYCGQMEMTARRLRHDYRGQVRFAFRQLPLIHVHPDAEKAAEASECAADQGNFWPAFEMFYDHQEDLTVPALERYAAQLGLNMARFRQCLSSGATAARVRRDVRDAQALNVRVTPTFFVDGHRYEGGMNYYQFSEILDHEIRGAAENQATKLETSPAVAAPASTNGPAPTSRSPKISSNTPLASTSPGTSVPASPETPSSPSSPSFFSGGPGSAFARLQNPAAGCSEDEARQRQPALINTSEARQIYQEGIKALFVDVRPLGEFENARIAGAVNIPLDEIARLWGGLPKDRSIIFYEAGRADGGEEDVCAASRSAGRFLLAHGFSADRVKVYQGGLKAWEKAGLPVERSPASGS